MRYRSLGTRAAGDDHHQALGPIEETGNVGREARRHLETLLSINLLGQAGDDGSQLAKDLQRLLPMKTKTECELDDVTRSIQRLCRRGQFGQVTPVAGPTRRSGSVPER